MKVTNPWFEAFVRECERLGLPAIVIGGQFGPTVFFHFADNKTSVCTVNMLSDYGPEDRAKWFVENR